MEVMLTQRYIMQVTHDECGALLTQLSSCDAQERACLRHNTLTSGFACV